MSWEAFLILAEYFIRHHFTWVLSAATISMAYLSGIRHPRTWEVAMVGQACWSLWIFVREDWGLVPMNVVLWYLYIKNYFQWKKNPPNRI